MTADVAFRIVTHQSSLRLVVESPPGVDAFEYEVHPSVLAHLHVELTKALEGFVKWPSVRAAYATREAVDKLLKERMREIEDEIEEIESDRRSLSDLEDRRDRLRSAMRAAR